MPGKTLSFGKYKGVPIAQIPSPYLLWLVESMESDAADIRTELERRRQAEESDMSMAEKIVQAGYRELAKRHHPDAGGSDTAMREVNAAVETLREMLRIDEAVRRGV